MRPACAGSRRFPQFNADALAPALHACGVGYQHIAALGGRRGRTLAKGESSPNGYWTNESFRRYADYALTQDFAAGMAELREASQATRCAVMCAEAVWWRCHRTHRTHHHSHATPFLVATLLSWFYQQYH